MPTQNHIDKRYFERSTYYNEWLRPRNIHFCFGVILSRTQEETQWLSLNLSKGTDGFGDRHVRFMEKLVPHLQRSVGLTRQLGAINTARSATPLVATLTPLLGERESWVTNSPAVAVLLNDPARARQLPEETLRTTFGLTPAESKLAGLLANGHPLSEAAETLHITRETARTHLAHTLAKSGASRQAELVRLLIEPPNQRVQQEGSFLRRFQQMHADSRSWNLARANTLPSTVSSFTHQQRRGCRPSPA